MNTIDRVKIAPEEPPGGEPTEWLWTVDEVLGLSKAGFLREGARVELIDGRLVEMASEGWEHARCKAKTHQWLNRVIDADPALRAAWLVFAGPFVKLDLRRGLEPDTLVADANVRARLHGQGDIALAVETAVRSAGYDLGLKRSLYAEAGVRELWIVLPIAQTALLCRDPVEGAYRNVTEVGPEDRLSPLFAPHASVLLGELLD